MPQPAANSTSSLARIFKKIFESRYKLPPKQTPFKQRFLTPALQRTNTENSKQIFEKKELRGHSPNFHIHVSVNVLYIPTINSSAGKYVDRSWEYINRSQTHECGNWDGGGAIPRKGIHKWDFRCSALQILRPLMPSVDISGVYF
jgi:hypothetical protein